MDENRKYYRPFVSPSDGQSKIICERCNSNGTYAENGKYLHIAAKRSYSKFISNMAPENKCSLSFCYKGETGGYTNPVELLSEEDEDDDVDTVLSGIVTDTNESYYVKLIVSDSAGEVSESVHAVPSENVFIHKREGGKGIGFGRKCEEDNLMDIDWDVSVRGNFYLGDEKIPISISAVLRVDEILSTDAAYADVFDIVNGYGADMAENVTNVLSFARVNSGIALLIDGENKLFLVTGYGDTYISIRYMTSLSGGSDYIVSRGYTNGWEWRKWNSGFAECWGYYTVSDVPCTTASGSMFVTATINPEMSFPSGLFSSVRNMQMSFNSSNGTPALIWCNGSHDTSKAASFMLMRHLSSGAVSGRMHYTYTGYWK